MESKFRERKERETLFITDTSRGKRKKEKSATVRHSGFLAGKKELETVLAAPGAEKEE